MLRKLSFAMEPEDICILNKISKTGQLITLKQLYILPSNSKKFQWCLLLNY